MQLRPSDPERWRVLHPDSKHSGDHRGDRAQWNEKGRVPITLKPDGTPKEVAHV